MAKGTAQKLLKEKNAGCQNGIMYAFLIVLISLLHTNIPFFLFFSGVIIMLPLISKVNVTNFVSKNIRPDDHN